MAGASAIRKDFTDRGNCGVGGESLGRGEPHKSHLRFYGDHIKGWGCRVGVGREGRRKESK